MSDAIIAFLIRGFGAGLGFALQALLARLMPVAEYGLFVMVWVWTLALGSFASLGLAEMALRVLPRYALRMRARVVADFVSHGFRTTAVVAIAASALVFGLSTFLPLSRDMSQVIGGVCLTLPVLALDFFLGGVARAMGWYTLGIVTVYIARPLLLMSACAALWFAGVELTGMVVCVVLMLGIVATTLFLRLIMHRRLGGSLEKPTTPTLRRFWLKQSFPMLLASGLDDVLGYADVVLVGVFLAPADAAIYFVASRVLMPASLVQYAFFYVAARKFSLALADDDVSALQRNFWRATVVTIMACSAAVALTVLASPLLLWVFGTEFSNATPLVLILALSQIARAASTQAQEYLMMAGRAVSVSWTNGICVAVLLASATFAVSRYDAIGVAWALTGALVLRALLLLKQSQSDFRNRTARR